MSGPLLSVGVPTYNGARFLEACLESLLAQEGVDLEVVLCDDASTDDTLAIARGIDDSRLKVHAFPDNLGLAGNWDRVLARATGRYFALVGQDDRVDEGWAARLVGLLESQPDADLAFGRRRFEFEDEESRAVVGDFFENRYPEMIGPFHARLDRTGAVIPAEVMIEEAMKFCFEINLIGEPSFVVVRRDTEAARAGFDQNMRQMIDWEFFTRFFVGRPIVHCPEVVGTYHIHARASSIENAPLSRHYREFVYLLDRVQERFAGLLSDGQREALRRRQEEARGLQREWQDKESRGDVDS